MTHIEVRSRFEIDQIDDDLGPGLFLQVHGARGHRHLLRRSLRRGVSRDALPHGADILQSIDADACFDVVAEVGGVLILLRSWKVAGDVWASASDPDAACALVDEVRARIPRDHGERRIEVRFTDEDSGDRYLRIDASPWADTRACYAPGVQRALDQLIDFCPASSGHGRLLLWHGAPGTGKTTAIRSLLYAWREWADGTVVTDPERLLSKGPYLRRAILDGQENDRWQVVILEDAESLLHKGSGNALAKLLNLNDGLLGQGLRCLFLITTNEPLAVMHPALLRPGRCLANVEFAALPAAQAAAVVGRPLAGAMTLAEALASKPVSVASDSSESRVGAYL